MSRKTCSNRVPSAVAQTHIRWPSVLSRVRPAWEPSCSITLTAIHEAKPAIRRGSNRREIVWLGKQVHTLDPMGHTPPLDLGCNLWAEPPVRNTRDPMAEEC